MSIRPWILVACAATAWPASAASADEQDLASRSRSILEERCHRCPGAQGQAEAGLYVLNYAQLVPQRVVAGEPDKSLLLRKVRDGEMPPDGDPLTEAEQQTLADWIAAGAPDFTPR